MKKRILLAATAFTLTCLGGQSLTAVAAPGNMNSIIRNGNRIIISYGSACSPNLQDIFDKIQNCIPEINLPDCENPETELPDTDAPEVNLPDNNTPENNFPGGDSNQENKPDIDSSTEQHAYIQEVVTLVNAERAKEGLSPLTLDLKVTAAAQVRAKECEQLFSHTRPNGTSFATALKEQNISYRRAGENIAWGQKTPQEVVTAWMNSAGHRANIMNKNFTTIGVGYYENARGTDYWCQLFIG